MLTWTPLDAFPESYEFFSNGESLFSGEWNGSTISLNLDSFGIGIYNITIIVFSESGNSIVDTVWVTVRETTTPSINHPADLFYVFGQLGFDITWYASDSAPDTYEIYRNGTLLDSGEWNATVITIGLDDISIIGVYNYTLVVYSESGTFSRDTVFVTVIEATTTIPTTTTTATETTTTTRTTTTGTETDQPFLSESTIMLLIGIGGGLIAGIMVSCIFTKVRKES